MIPMSPFCSAWLIITSWCAALFLPPILSLLPFFPPACPYGHLGKCSPKASPPQILSPFGALPYLPSLRPSPALWQHCLATQLGYRWWLSWWWRFSKQKGIWVFPLSCPALASPSPIIVVIFKNIIVNLVDQQGPFIPSNFLCCYFFHFSIVIKHSTDCLWLSLCVSISALIWPHKALVP